MVAVCVLLWPLVHRRLDKFADRWPSLRLICACARLVGWMLQATYTVPVKQKRISASKMANKKNAATTAAAGGLRPGME